MEALNSFIRVGKILEINEMMEKFMGDDWSRDSQYVINNHGAYDESWDKLISVFNKASKKVMLDPIMVKANAYLSESIKTNKFGQLDKEKTFFKLGEFLKLYNQYQEQRKQTKTKLK